MTIGLLPPPVRAPEVSRDVRLDSGQMVALDLIGPSLWGSVYREVGTGHICRLIPDLTGDQRHQFTEMVGTPRMPSVAPVLECSQQLFDDGPWFFVRYDTGASTSLDELMAAEPAERLAAVAATVATLPRWWGPNVNTGVMPLPTDVAVAAGATTLLPMPPLGLPGITRLLEEPSRLLFLAPEVARGDEASVWGNSSDVWCLGVMLAGCLLSLTAQHAEDSLHTTLGGAAADPARWPARVPAWMQRLAVMGSLFQVARTLTDPRQSARSALDGAALVDLAARITSYLPGIEPLAAVRGLWQTGRPDLALQLAHDVLVDNPSYKLFVLAAQVAGRGLGNPLEALALLDQALAVDGSRPEAYTEQFQLIAKLPIDILTEIDSSWTGAFAERIDASMWRAYERQPDDQLGETASDMTRYLSARGKVDEAQAFAYEALRTSTGELRWHRSGLMLAYAEAFALSGDQASARAVIAAVRDSLAYMRQGKGMAPELLDRFQRQAAVLDARLAGEQGRPT